MACLPVEAPIGTMQTMSTIPDQTGRRGAVAVIVREGRLLVIRRSGSVVAPWKFCFPGGGIEGQESEEEALVRELREELGCEVTPCRRLWQNVTPWGVHLAWWLAELPPDVEPAPNPRRGRFGDVAPPGRNGAPNCPTCWRAIANSSPSWPTEKSA